MGAPGLVPGGPLINYSGSLTSAQVKVATHGDPVYGDARGVFGKHPGATPKWAINNGTQRDAEFRETMARFFIEMPEQERQAFVASCPPESQPLARVLCGVDPAGGGGTGFVDFLLQSAVEDFQEKYQIVETLSDNFIIYVFGQRAVPFQYSGMLLNTYQDDQRVWMTRLYRDILRGTQLARRRKLVRLRYDSVIVSGVMLGLRMQLDGTLENGVPFSFVLQPTHYTIFTPDEGVPTQLKTAFTEAASLALPSTAVPDTTQLRVASPTSGQIPKPTETRQNEKTDNPYGSSTAAPPTTATDQLKNRTGGTKAAPEAAKDVRG